MAFPLLGAAAIGAGANLLSGLFNGLSARSNQNVQNEFNSAEAQKARDWSTWQNMLTRDWQSAENATNRSWQSRESAQARKWQEDMYNMYSSPSAMMAQYRAAGLNPFLAMSGNVGSGMSASAPLSGSPSSGSPSVLGAPAASSSPSGLSLGLPSDYSSVVRAFAESANQRAQSISQFTSAAIDVYKNLGRDAYDKFIENFAPSLVDGDPEQSLFTRETNSRINQLDINSAVNDYGLQLTKRFVPRERQVAIDKVLNDIKVSTAQLDINKALSNAQIEKIASDIVHNAASAFKLKMEGNKLIADTITINALREFVISVAMSDARLKENEVISSDNERYSLASWRAWRESAEGRESEMKSRSNPLKRNADGLWQALDRFFSVYLKTSVSGKGD